MNIQSYVMDIRRRRENGLWSQVGRKEGKRTELGIYKRKQDSKKTRKHDFDKESDQATKKKKESDKKKDKLSFFLDRFLGRLLGRERINFLFFFLLSCFPL